MNILDLLLHQDYSRSHVLLTALTGKSVKATPKIEEKILIRMSKAAYKNLLNQ